LDFSDIELIALRDVWLTRLRLPGVSEDFHIHRIFREYSKKFVTPLHEVYDLPVEFVVQRWMEDLYEDWKDEDLIAEAVSLLKPHDKVMAERRMEDADDAEMFLLGEDVKRSEAAAKKMEDAIKALSGVASMLRGPTLEEKVTGGRLSKPSELANVKVDPGKKIEMSFGNFDLDADSFGLLDEPAPKSPNSK
jgi:hypothetical protein